MDWTKLLQDYGWPTAILVVVLVTGWREMWYYGPTVRKQQEREQERYDKDVAKLEVALKESRDLNYTLLRQNRESLTIGQQIAEALKVRNGK